MKRGENAFMFVFTFPLLFNRNLSLGLRVLLNSGVFFGRGAVLCIWDV